ncbi:putative signal transduction protein [Geobacillus proteiniphilus]|nr:putative signal transduction protein [Geobacillus proteiniphilus]
MLLVINELKKWISVLALQKLYDLHAHLYQEIVTLSFKRESL